MEVRLEAISGSFRDPVNQVYQTPPGSTDGKSRILRGLSASALEDYQRLAQERFFSKAIKAGQITQTELLTEDDAAARAIMADGWTGVLEHEPVPFITYPYEWTFSMLKDAALLQLQLIETSLENGWTLKQ